MRRPEFALALLLLPALAGLAAAADKPVRPGSMSANGRDNVMLSQTYLAQGRIDAAEERARAALASDGDFALPHVAMAMVLAHREKPGKAGKEFDRALALGPNDGVVLNAYGAWLCGQGDSAGADQAFRRALADPGYRAPFQALVNAGRCAIRASDWSKGEGYLRRAVVIQPTHRSALLMLAEAELNLGRAFDARAFVERSDALGPDAATLELAARIEDAAGDAQSAARYRQRLRELPPPAPAGQGTARP